MQQAADAIRRSYNQPTKANLRAAAIAQKVFQDAGVADTEYRKLFSQQGVNNAVIENWASQSALRQKETAVLPGNFEEKKASDIEKIKAGHPPQQKTEMGSVAVALAASFKGDPLTGTPFDLEGYKAAIQGYKDMMKDSERQNNAPPPNQQVITELKKRAAAGDVKAQQALKAGGII